MADIDFDALLDTAAPAIEDEDYADRVKRGAVWLDAVRPDWYQGVDLETLRMSSSCECILGQVAGSYNVGEDRWMAKHYEAEDLFNEVGVLVGDEDDLLARRWVLADHGFLARGAISKEDSTSWHDIETDYEGLTGPWKQAIEERLAQD